MGRVLAGQCGSRASVRPLNGGATRVGRSWACGVTVGVFTRAARVAGRGVGLVRSREPKQGSAGEGARSRKRTL
eukprot:scaffold34310_cov31-Tisochrysis_lutea.AAC.2